jgi:hypothetical protein
MKYQKTSTSMLNLRKNGQKTRHKGLSLTITLTVLFLALLGVKAGDFSAGPIFDQFPLTLDVGHRTEILGPFYYSQESDSNKLWALPPFFSDDSDPTIDLREDYFLYPVFSYVKYGTQYRGQFIQLFSFAGGEDPDEVGRHRFMLFPIYFQQRSRDPQTDYTAVFPFYGHLNNTLFRDHIYFVMFPAYSRTQKKDIINYNYLYPFFNTRQGDGMHGWQFWPFYGSEHKVLTTFTNTWGVETNGGHDRYFVLWPIHLWENNGIGTDDPEKLRADIPFYVKYRSPLRDSTSVLWPFFNWIDDREKKYREWEMPWPFIIVARGEGKTATRVFPFYNRAHNQNFEDNFYLWPIYKFNGLHSPPLDRRRTRIVLFLYQNTADKNTETGKIKRRIDLWPLFVYHHNFDGNTRLQVPALIETFFPDNPGVERNWSPLWSIWRSENNLTNNANSQSFLWNFYRRDASPDAKKISFFFGLYQYESNPEMEKTRLFYIPIHQVSRKPQ